MLINLCFWGFSFNILKYLFFWFNEILLLLEFLFFKLFNLNLNTLLSLFSLFLISLPIKSLLGFDLFLFFLQLFNFLLDICEIIISLFDRKEVLF